MTTTEKPWMCHCCHHPFGAPVMMDGRKHSPCCSSLNIEGPATFVDVSTITEYGLTQKLSNAVRVF